jgi:hypothetical protein
MSKLISCAFSLTLLAIAAAIFFSATSAGAAIISTQDTVVVLRVGEGSAALAATSAPAYLEEYAIGFDGGGVPVSATHVQTIPIPVPVIATFGTGLTIAGTASLEGGLNFSENGQYLMFAGYHGAVGDPTSGKRKIVGRVNIATDPVLPGGQEFDAIYGAGTTAAGAAIRTVASNTGNEYWFGMTNAAVGVSYRTWEGGDDPGVASTLINAQNPRRLEIDNSQLYVSSAAAGIFGVATVGTGTPTSASGVAILPGMPTATGPSPVDYFFADPNTLYVADDRTNTNGGLQKWVFDSGSGNWTLVYTKNVDTSNDTFDNGLRGLTGGMVGADGTVTLFGTSTFGTAGGANFLMGISDTLANTNAANVIVNTLASAASIPGAGGANANFRGLEAIGVVIPEPGSIAVLAIANVLLLGLRRHRS